MTSLIINPPTFALIPTINATVSPSTSVVVGTPMIVNWTSTNCAVMKITGLINSTLINGQARITAPTVPGTYLITLESTSSTGDSSPLQIISITVSSATAIIPNIVLTAIPGGTVVPGASVKFSWTVTNAVSATIVSAALGINSTVLNGSATVVAPSISGNIYTVVVNAISSDGNTSTKSISITIDNIPNVTGTFDPYTVNPNQVTKLTWNSVNASTLVLTGLGINSSSLIGTSSITAPTTLGVQSVNWTAKNLAGTASYTGVFKLNVVAATPVIPNITGSFAQSSVTTLEPTSFTWNVTNATNVVVSGLVNNGLLSGTQSIPLQPTVGTYTVTITATSSTRNTESASFQLIVTNPVDIIPTFNGAFSPSTVNPGQPSILSWTGTDLKSLKLVNAALSINQTYTNQSSGTLTITAPNNILTHLVTYTGISPTNYPITGTIPLIIQQASIIPSVTGSFSIAQPLPNQTTVLTYYPIGAVQVVLTSKQLSINETSTVVSGSSYTKNIAAPTAPGVYTVTMEVISSTGHSRTAIATFEVVAILPTITASLNLTSTTPGKTTVLSWTATQAATVTISSTDLNLNTTFGSLTGTYAIVSPSALATYTVTVTATSTTGTTSSATVSFTVKAEPIIPEVTGSFTPYTVNPGQPTSLTWSTTNTDLMSLTGDVTSSLLASTASVKAPSTLGKRTVSYTATSTTNDIVSGIWAYEVVAVTPVTPQINGTFNPATIKLGQSSTFTWTTTDATLMQLQINGVTSNESLNGSRVITPAVVGNQAVGCLATSRTGHTANPIFNLTVTAATKPTVSGSFSPTTITLGESTTFTWKSTDATALTISGLVNSALLSGSLTVKPSTTGTQTVSYSATSPGNAPVTGQFTMQVNAVVVPIVPTVTGSFSPATVPAGDPCTFTWSSTSAASMLLSGAVNNSATSGSASVDTSVMGTKTVTYTVTSSTNTARTGKFDLVVTAATPVIPSASGSFNPTTVELGGSTTLTWSSTDATALALSGAYSSSALTGTQVITPSVTGTTTVNYTATSRTGNKASGTFTMQVVPVTPVIPQVVGLFNPTTIELGKSTILSWSSTDATSLTLSGAYTSSLLSGTQVITPSATGTATVNYTATSRTGNRLSGSFTVQVNAVTPIYPVINQAGTYWSKSTLNSGLQNTLNWQIDNAVRASLSGQVTASTVTGSTTITVPTTPGTYSVYIDATSSTGHSLQAGPDGKLPRHVDFQVVTPVALKGLITSPTELSTKRQRQIVITGDATAGTQNYTVTSGLLVADTVTGAPLTGTIGNERLTICLVGPVSAGTATLTLTKSGYTSYTGSAAYAASTVYSPFTWERGAHAWGLTAAEIVIAKWISENLYKSISIPFTTTFGVRYGLGRAPDYPGITSWTQKCVSTYGSNYQGQAFKSAFFDIPTTSTDSARSKTPTKTYDPGSGYGDFYNKP